MTTGESRLHLHTAPFLKQRITTPGLMRDVLLAATPVVLASIWFFGIGAILVLAAATAGAVGCEWVFTPRTLRSVRIGDGSAVLTGVLLGLTLPPGIPLWIAFVGGVVGLGLGKIVWGGLGQNLFNPALVGRAFLQAAFPTALTTWGAPGGRLELFELRGPLFAPPLLHQDVDAVSTATPLALMRFQGETPELLDLLVGGTGGSLGETSAGLLILCGLWMLARRTFDWRIPVSILATVALFSGILHGIDAVRFPAPQYMLLSGGLLFGTLFMATDPVTSPLAPRSAFAFGIGVGFLVVLIRLFGGFPEGMMYAILLMNSATPLLERRIRPRAFGRAGSR